MHGGWGVRQRSTDILPLGGCCSRLPRRWTLGCLPCLLLLPLPQLRFLPFPRCGSDVTGEKVEIDVGVLALELVDGLSEVGHELLLVAVVEEAAGKCSERC